LWLEVGVLWWEEGELAVTMVPHLRGVACHQRWRCEGLLLGVQVSLQGWEVRLVPWHGGGGDPHHDLRLVGRKVLLLLVPGVLVVLLVLVLEWQGRHVCLGIEVWGRGLLVS